MMAATNLIVDNASCRTANLIHDVELRIIGTHADERGFFREIVKRNENFMREGFGQFSHSMMRTGVIKAWHIHKKQVDWWYVVGGLLKVGLYDTRKDSPTPERINSFLMGEFGGMSYMLRIPPGVAHGCKCIEGPCNLLYLTSQPYDPDDEGRIPYDDPKIDFDWLKGPDIK